MMILGVVSVWLLIGLLAYCWFWRSSADRFLIGNSVYTKESGYHVVYMDRIVLHGSSMAFACHGEVYDDYWRLVG
jgi:hypothetical protein